MRIVHNDEVCEVSADDFWSLRMDTGFDRFIAEGDKQIWSLLSSGGPAGADGAVAMRRHTKLNFKENRCVVAARRARRRLRLLVQGDGHFYPRSDEGTRRYSTAFPVLADAISVVGKQWALAAGPNRCRLVSRVEVSVALTGLGGSIEKLIERGVKDAARRPLAGRRSTWRSADRGRRRPCRPAAAVEATRARRRRRARRAARRRAGRRRTRPHTPLPAPPPSPPRRRRRSTIFARRRPTSAAAWVKQQRAEARAATGGARAHPLRRRRVAAAADGDAAARVSPSSSHLASLSTLASPSPSGGSAGLSRRRLPLSVLRRGGRGVGGGRAAAGVARAGERLRASLQTPKRSWCGMSGVRPSRRRGSNRNSSLRRCERPSSRRSSDVEDARPGTTEAGIGSNGFAELQGTRVGAGVGGCCRRRR